MPLRTETTFEYYFNNASLYYCKAHDCFRVTDDHEDSVLLNGVTEENIDEFIKMYNKYVKKVPELKVVEDAS